jgi:membrane protease YdiL (CAAX protease family)
MARAVSRLHRCAMTGQQLRQAALFYALATGLAWLVALPLWLDSRHLAAPYATPLMAVMMWTPGLSAWITSRLLHTPLLGDSVRWSLRGGRFRWALLAVGMAVLFCVAAPFVGALLGVFELDLELSGFRQTLIESGATMDPSTALLVQLASLPVGIALTSVFALGEELGWRGFLMQRFSGLHAALADVLTGLLWALWHAPVLLLGYNFPEAPLLGTLLGMPLVCVVLSLWMGPLTRRGGSVLVAALAHGAGNAAAGFTLLLQRAGTDLDELAAGPTGWSGQLLPLVVCAVLWWRGTGAVSRSRPPHGDSLTRAT